MKKRGVKAFALAAAMLLISIQTAVADGPAEGENSGLRITFIAQNDQVFEGGVIKQPDVDYTGVPEDPVYSFNYMEQEEVFAFEYLPAGHLDVVFDSTIYKYGYGPMRSAYFSIHAQKGYKQPTCDFAITNWVLHFEGYDDITMPDQTFKLGDGVKLYRVDVFDLFTDENRAEMINHFTGYSMDYSIIGLDFEEMPEPETSEEGDYEESESDVPAVIETEPPTNETDPPVDETEPIAETSSPELETEKGTEKAAETKVDEEIKVSENESTEKDAKEDKAEEPSKNDEKEEKSGSSIKLIITIVAIVLLAIALGFVAFVYFKKMRM